MKRFEISDDGLAKLALVGSGGLRLPKGVIFDLHAQEHYQKWTIESMQNIFQRALAQGLNSEIANYFTCCSRGGRCDALSAASLEVELRGKTLPLVLEEDISIVKRRKEGEDYEKLILQRFGCGSLLAQLFDSYLSEGRDEGGQELREKHRQPLLIVYSCGFLEGEEVIGEAIKRTSID